MRARSDGVVALELAPEAFASAFGEGGVDVANGVPGRFVELDGTGDGVAEQQGAFLPRGDDDAEVSRSVSGGERGSDAGAIVVSRSIGRSRPSLQGSLKPCLMWEDISPGPVTKWWKSPAPYQIVARGKIGFAARSNSHPTWSTWRWVQTTSVTSEVLTPWARRPVRSSPPTSRCRPSWISGPSPASTSTTRSPERIRKQPRGSQAAPCRSNSSGCASGARWLPKYSGRATKVPSEIGCRCRSPMRMGSSRAAT